MTESNKEILNAVKDVNELKKKIHDYRRPTKQ